MNTHPSNRQRPDLNQVVKLIVAIASLIAAIHTLLKYQGARVGAFFAKGAHPA
jgi:hypothetical protein